MENEQNVKNQGVVSDKKEATTPAKSAETTKDYFQSINTFREEKEKGILNKIPENKFVNKQGSYWTIDLD